MPQTLWAFHLRHWRSSCIATSQPFAFSTMLSDTVRLGSDTTVCGCVPAFRFLTLFDACASFLFLPLIFALQIDRRHTFWSTTSFCYFSWVLVDLDSRSDLESEEWPQRTRRIRIQTNEEKNDRKEFFPVLRSIPSTCSKMWRIRQLPSIQNYKCPSLQFRQNFQICESFVFSILTGWNETIWWRHKSWRHRKSSRTAQSRRCLQCAPGEQRNFQIGKGDETFSQNTQKSFSHFAWKELLYASDFFRWRVCKESSHFRFCKFFVVSVFQTHPNVTCNVQQTFTSKWNLSEKLQKSVYMFVHIFTWNFTTQASGIANNTNVCESRRNKSFCAQFFTSG